MIDGCSGRDTVQTSEAGTAGGIVGIVEHGYHSLVTAHITFALGVGNQRQRDNLHLHRHLPPRWHHDIAISVHFRVRGSQDSS